VPDLKRKLLAAVLVIAAAGLFALTATTASATPSRTTRCVNCHGGVDVPVTATLASTTGTTATYNVSAPTANAIAVFDGTTRLTTISAASGQFTVAFGKTYTIYAVKGPTETDGLGSTTVSPVAPAPVPDTTAPTTTSNAKASYVSAASITLTAVDNAGGSGVAHTYYILDSDPQAEGLTVTTSVVGSHTLSFWSVDVAGNIEAANTATFDVTATPVGTPKCTIDSMVWSNRHGHHVVRLTGTISPAQVGDHAVLYVQRPGSHRWMRAATLTARALDGNGGATWSYSYTAQSHGSYRFQVRFGDMVSGAMRTSTSSHARSMG
jgi:hypothetical protein